jgi:hypothetical protein
MDSGGGWTMTEVCGQQLVDMDVASQTSEVRLDIGGVLGQHEVAVLQRLCVPLLHQVGCGTVAAEQHERTNRERNICGPVAAEQHGRTNRERNIK